MGKYFQKPRGDRANLYLSGSFYYIIPPCELRVRQGTNIRQQWNISYYRFWYKLPYPCQRSDDRAPPHRSVWKEGGLNMADYMEEPECMEEGYNSICWTGGGCCRSVASSSVALASAVSAALPTPLTPVALRPTAPSQSAWMPSRVDALATLAAITTHPCTYKPISRLHTR